MELNYNKEREAFEKISTDHGADIQNSVHTHEHFRTWCFRAEIAQAEEAKYKSLNGELIGKLHALQIKLKAEQDQSNQQREQATEYFTDCEFMKAQITELQQKLAKYENPDYVLVPREPTDEVCEIIALSAKVCGGIALDIYTAMIEEVEKSK